MAFRLPNFNLTCNIWRTVNFVAGAMPVGPPALAGVPCNKQFGKKEGAEAARFGVWCLLPHNTDIRAYTFYAGKVAGQGDAVECPAGSGAYYSVLMVDDVSSGFPTEYRSAFMTSGGFFGNAAGYTDPIPWPGGGGGGGGGTPGATCLTAGTLILGAPYTGNIALGANDWWTFPVVAGLHYTVAMTQNAGAMGPTGVYYGTCAAPTLVGNVFPYPGNVQWIQPVNSMCLVQVNPPTLPGTNYTILATTP